MRSVTDQILGDGALDRIIEEGGVSQEELNDGVDVKGAPMPAVEKPIRPLTDDDRRRNFAESKLRVALSTADRMHAPKATGVGFSSPLRGQMQEIFTDGSVRNPYKKMRGMSGRQRRLMRKNANRTMKARGINARLEDTLKGRKRAQPETAETQD